jgi:5-methylcytosine-specific restriction endonuclease McrA
VCSKCRKELPISEFHRSAKHKFGVHSQCKECGRAYWRQHSKKRHDAVAKYREANKEKVRMQRAVSKHNCRWGAAKGQFTVEQWVDLLKSTGNKCLRCDKPGPETKEGHLTIDHVRPVAMGATNRIENIQPLCRSCNCKKGQRYCDYRGNSLNSKSAA